VTQKVVGGGKFVPNRERFGWWPVRRARRDKRSRARFTVRGHAGVPARVVLVGPDRATPLTESPVLKLPH